MSSTLSLPGRVDGENVLTVFCSLHRFNCPLCEGFEEAGSEAAGVLLLSDAEADIRHALWWLECRHLIENPVEILLLLVSLWQLMRDLVEGQWLEAEHMNDVASHGQDPRVWFVLRGNQGGAVAQKNNQEMDHVLDNV